MNGQISPQLINFQIENNKKLQHNILLFFYCFCANLSSLPLVFSGADGCIAEIYYICLDPILDSVSLYQSQQNCQLLSPFLFVFQLLEGVKLL